MTICVGLDPGTRNPALSVLEHSAAGWKILRLPVLHSVDELNAELVDLHRQGIAVDVCCAEKVDWSLHAKTQGFGSGTILKSVGAVQLFAALMGSKYIEVGPRTWRCAAAGSGNASKEQVRNVVKRRVAGWPTGPVSLNRSDAVAIAICGRSLA